MAMIYHNVGLLPTGHAYLQTENYGRYGIRHVVFEAGRNLTFSRRNLDQVCLYFLMLAGMVLILIQFVLLGVSIASYPVFAASLWTQYFIDTPVGHTPSQDLAFVVLDTVFGVMRSSGETGGLGFFESCFGDTGTDCEDIRGNIVFSPIAYPMPLHQALHGLLHFYTSGIAFVAGLIIIYFIIAIIGETVVSGTPFGQRFSKAWFIPRLIVFFALIAPINTSTATGGGYINNQGINVAQLITFSVAKFGSNFATNAWLGFVDSAGVTTVVDADGNTYYQVAALLGQGQNMVARPNVPDIGGLVQFMHVVRACMYAEKVINDKDVHPYVVREHNDDTTATNLPPNNSFGAATQPYNEMGGTDEDVYDFLDIDFEEAVIFSRYRDVVVRFGEYNPPGWDVPGTGSISTTVPSTVQNPRGVHDEYWGYVEPTCGEMHFQITSLDRFVVGDNSGTGIQGEYYESMQAIISSPYIDFDTTAECMVRATLPQGHRNDCVDTPYTGIDLAHSTQWITAGAARSIMDGETRYNSTWITGEIINAATYSYLPGFDKIRAAEADREDPDYPSNVLMPAAVRERGWAGAAIWYNQVASLNGLVSSAFTNLPVAKFYPMVMEDIARQHAQHDSNMSFTDRFNPELENGQMASLPRMGDQYLASILYGVYSSWTTAAVTETVFTRPAKNAIIDVINMMLGTNGLYDLLENKGVHPLAMLSGLGKSMVDAAVRNMFIGVAGQTIGEMFSDNFAGKISTAASSFAFKFGMIGLSIGFLLYYILPLMPFIYFFFAFSGWVKSIFEAVVAMPLWAVAHIRIDGNGLPGPLATNGYFLLFEIFLRPILIITGFIFSMSLFIALVNVLHDVFTTLTLNAAGYDFDAGVYWNDIINAGGRLENLGHTPGDRSFSSLRGPVDELFFTAIYAMIVYMIGLSCFKLVDQIPNSIIRWMGATVSTFQESAGFDPASKLASNMFRSINMTNAQITAMMKRFKGETNVRDVQDAAIINTTIQ
ncbi:MAG: DotA/TraY family protein [Alphaproteobacteria bacterium]